MLVEERENVAPTLERAQELHAGATAHGDLLDLFVLVAMGVTLAARPNRHDRTLERGLATTAVNRRNRNAEFCERGGAEFPVAEMRTDHDGPKAAMTRGSRAEMLEAVHFD